MILLEFGMKNAMAQEWWKRIPGKVICFGYRIWADQREKKIMSEKK